MQRNPREKSPCETCGACCAFFRVSVRNVETDDVPGGVVPADMTFLSNDSQRCMKGTEAKTRRCIALEGRVGVHVKCGIYESRPSSCREFSQSWKNDIGNRRCDQARGFFGLQPFSPY